MNSHKLVSYVGTYCHMSACKLLELILGTLLQNEIIEYDAHRITPEMRTAVNRLLAQKGASFEQATIFRVSQAAAPLAAWVIANLQYADVLQKVAPLEQELGGLTANYTQSQVGVDCWCFYTFNDVL